MKAERLVIDSNVRNAALISPAGTARPLVETVLDREPDSWHSFLTALV